MADMHTISVNKINHNLHWSLRNCRKKNRIHITINCACRLQVIHSKYTRCYEENV